MLPLLPTIRPFVFSYDATHSLGTHSFGIKIDAIPGRFNFTSTIRTIIKGEHRGFRYELRGHGHSSMPIVGLVICVRRPFIDNSLKYCLDLYETEIIQAMVSELGNQY